MLFAGIDGGQNGAIVVIDNNNAIIYKTIMPVIKSNEARTEYDVSAIKNIFKNFVIEYGVENIVAGIEKVQITPISGKNAVASMYFCYGLFQGVLSALGISYRVFRAKDWQKEILSGINGSDTKQRSIIFCKRKYPNESWKRTERCENDSDGLTDACCIANFLRLKEGDANAI